MLNVIFLWFFSRGIEQGVIVLCLLPLRLLLRKKVPRVFSYLLWAVLPVNIGYNLVMSFVVLINCHVVDYIYDNPKIIVNERIIHFMTWCWLGGTLVVVFGLAYSYIRFLRRLVGSIRMQKGIYIADRIEAPFTLGLLYPKIYLPITLKEEYYESVILHERVHIARKDIWMKHMAVGFLGLFWFQPILWVAYRWFINDMEEACDETVLRKKGTDFKTEYARSLLEVSCQVSKVQGAAIGYGNGEIKTRIENVMRYEHAGKKKCVLAVLLCVLFINVAIPISWQMPRLVRAEETKEYTEGRTTVENTGLKKKSLINEK